MVSRGGFVLACSAMGTFHCGVVLSGQGDLRGIAIDAINGYFIASIIKFFRTTLTFIDITDSCTCRKTTTAMAVEF